MGTPKSLVEVPLKKIKIDATSYTVTDDKGVILLSQITSDNTLLFEAKVGLGETKIYYISDDGKRNNDNVKAYGRYFPERYGDFAWENDCVGFRLYGHPLETIQASTNGIDIWLKRTTRMVLEDWYENDISQKASYHIDHGEGCDPYGVGPTLGAGAIAPYINGEIVRNTNFINYKVLDKGPLRVKFEITYPNIEVDGKTIRDSKIFTLDAGSYYTKVEQDFGANKLDVAVGIVKRAGKNSIYTSQNGNILIYEEPEMPKDGQVYVGIIFPNNKMEVKQDEYTVGKNKFSHNLAITTALKGKLVYYTGFGWSKSEHAQFEDFIQYSEDYLKSLELPLKVTISKLK